MIYEVCSQHYRDVTNKFVKIDHINPMWESTLPLNWKEVTKSELSDKNFLMYTPTHIESRYLCFDRDGKPLNERISVTLFYNRSGDGWAIRNNLKTHDVQFYTFGCNHEFGGHIPDEVAAKYETGKCLHILYCRKCGYNTQVDSSD